MTVTAYLGLGTNLGDRYQQLLSALERLHQSLGIRVTGTSSIYETIPVGVKEQPLFYNMVCEIQTWLTPKQLLESVLLIEQQLKRVRTNRWGPRTIDIDILLYGTHILQEKELIVPHPRMLERGFVLVPLHEIQRNIVIPGTEKTVGEWLNQLPDKQGVQRIKQSIDLN